MAFTKVAPAGIGSTPGDGYRIGDSFLHSTGVEITNINATGIVTAASLDISGAIDFDGQTNLDHVNIAGITTLSTGINLTPATSNLYATDGALSYYAANNGVYLCGAGANGWLRLQAAGSANDRTSINLKGHSASGGDSIYFRTNSTERLNISSTGSITVSGTISPTANNTYDLGGSSNTWRQLYVNNVNVAGVSTFSNSINIADKLIHSGDTDTSIRFPTNDQIALETAGTRWFHLGSTGAFQMGNNSNAGAKLYIKNSNADANNLDSLALDIQGAWLRIGDAILGDQTYSNGIGIKFHNSATAHHSISAQGQDLYFSTTSSNGNQLWPSSRTDSLRLTGAGAAIFAGDITAGGNLYIPDRIYHVGDTNTQIRFPANDTITFETGGGERLRITSTGTVLKGITTARQNYSNNTSGVEYGFQIESTNATKSSLSLIRSSNDVNDGGIFIGKTRSTSVGGNTAVQAGDDLGTITFGGADGTSLLFGAEILAEVQSGVGNDDMPTDLIFKTNGGSTSTAERLRITSDGKIGINDAAPERTMDVRGSNCMIQLEGTAGNGKQYSLCSTDDATGAGVDGGPSGSFAIYDDSTGQARLRIDPNGNTTFLVTGGTLLSTATGAYGISIHNHNSPSMGHLFIYGDNGLIRFRNTSNTYTAQMGYTESNNTLFFANQEGGTTMYITGDGVKLYDNNKFLCGNDDDLGIYHDNSNAYVENTSGSIYFRHSGSNKVEMKSAGGIKFHNQASGNFIQYSNSTVAPNAAINLQRYGNGYCDMRLSSNYGAKVMLAGASDNTDEFVMQQGNTKEAYINNEATGKHINLQIGGTTKLQIGDDAESVRIAGTSADHTGTTGGSKGLTLQYGGGYSVPLYFGNETHSAQKSMYLYGYWIYLRGHQNEGIRFVFSQPAGNAIRGEKYQFKYNQALNANNSTTWNTSSDGRAKENVQTITNGIEIIKKLRPVTFDWTNDYADTMSMWVMDKSDPQPYNWFVKKENGYDTDRKNGQYGFIAQEYETVLPKDVVKDKYTLGDTELDDFRTMTNDSLLPSLTAALKEAIAKIETLEAKVAALEGS